MFDIWKKRGPSLSSLPAKCSSWLLLFCNLLLNVYSMVFTGFMNTVYRTYWVDCSVIWFRLLWPPGGSHLWFSVKYSNYYQMDFQEIDCKHSCLHFHFSSRFVRKYRHWDIMFFYTVSIIKNTDWFFKLIVYMQRFAAVVNFFVVCQGMWCIQMQISLFWLHKKETSFLISFVFAYGMTNSF